MSPTILIADSDAESTALSHTYLSRCDYRVLTASGGVECLRILRDESPTAIVAAVDMPWGGIDGLLDYLGEERFSLQSQKVILVGHAAEEKVAELTRWPCVFRYLRKPFMMGRLLDYVRAIEFDLRDASRPDWNLQKRRSSIVCDPC